jgi:hypothetical protein
LSRLTASSDSLGSVFDRDRSIQRDVLRAVDDAHPPGSQPAGDAELRRDDERDRSVVKRLATRGAYANGRFEQAIAAVALFGGCAIANADVERSIRRGWRPAVKVFLQRDPR